MTDTVLATKLYVPPTPPGAVPRARLIDRLNAGQHGKLTLISAPAGFGKTTIASTWVGGNGRPVAWVSLDEGDSDERRFMTYLVAALQTISPQIGSGLSNTPQLAQSPPMEALLTNVLNDIAAIPEPFTLVLDDYHLIDAKPVDDALTFLIEHLPPQMHLVITTREDPQLPLARLRVRGQLTELRAADLRFTSPEAAVFLNQAMGLNLSDADIAALEQRTEGWIAGLQLAAISMRGHEDAARFITSFTGSHRFVLDYLVEEVLSQQPEHIQTFLLRTSILNRLSGSLCDALLGSVSGTGQDILERLEHSNLFIVPLDDERRWYRYHHLFAELLRQRLQQQSVAGSDDVVALNVRASVWFEAQGLEYEAFHHATAANDIERALRLIEGTGMPLHLRGGVMQVLAWLETLPEAELNARPVLWVTYASALSIAGQLARMEPVLRAADAVLDATEQSDEVRDLIGRIAGLRGIQAVMTGDPRQMETVITQSERALEYLHPNRHRDRNGAIWRIGLAHHYLGDRVAARLAFDEAIAASEESGNLHVNVLATTCVARLQQMENQLQRAEQTYRRVLQLVGDPPGPVACEAYLGLARLAYEWNDLDTAEEYGLLSVSLARQLESSNFIVSEVFLARLQITRGDLAGAVAVLAGTEHVARERGFEVRLPEIAAVQVSAYLAQGHLADATRLVQQYDLPLSRARVELAQGQVDAALATLQARQQQVEERGWADERLKTLVLRAIAYDIAEEPDTALQLLEAALELAEPGGFVRLFIDEGAPMARLLSRVCERGIRQQYTDRLLAAFAAEEPTQLPTTVPTHSQPLIEPLSPRELEVLRLIAAGLSNREIADRLFLALDTVKGHNRVIFGKLLVNRRTEAVARARELDLL